MGRDQVAEFEHNVWARFGDFGGGRLPRCLTRLARTNSSRRSERHCARARWLHEKWTFPRAFPAPIWPPTVGRGGLENRCRGNPPTEGSNPSPSAQLPCSSLNGRRSGLLTGRAAAAAKRPLMPLKAV
jgi:hypothetical protein